MATNRKLKIDLLKDQNDYSRKIQSILSGLSQVDVKASLLPIEKAIASRILIKKLWDALPDEYDSYQFDDIEEQTTKGKKYLPTVDFNQSVTIHLGWDIMSFACSLDAAWQSWKYFHALSIDTFNCCIYPDNLEWYIVRAGNNLYPMSYSEDRYQLINKQGRL